MMNKRIIDYAFLKYYYEIKSDDGIIDFNIGNDRIKLVIELFEHSSLLINNRLSLFQSFVVDYYHNNELDLISFSKELYGLFGFIILKIENLVMDSEYRDDNLIQFIDDLVDIHEDFRKICDYELYERFEEAFHILKNIFNNDFPDYTEKLIEDSFLNEKSPFYNQFNFK